MQKPQKKTTFFGQIEDVISVGALLRPSIAKAVAELKPSDLEAFEKIVIEAERELADSRLEFRERFSRAQERMVRAHVFSPSWRFISGRIRECWESAPALTVKELSLVSLLLGMMLEAAQARIQDSSKKNSKRIA
jgi:hypothetical protein